MPRPKWSTRHLVLAPDGNADTGPGLPALEMYDRAGPVRASNSGGTRCQVAISIARRRTTRCGMQGWPAEALRTAGPVRAARGGRGRRVAG